MQLEIRNTMVSFTLVFDVKNVLKIAIAILIHKKEYCGEKVKVKASKSQALCKGLLSMDSFNFNFNLIMAIFINNINS